MTETLLCLPFCVTNIPRIFLGLEVRILQLWAVFKAYISNEGCLDNTNVSCKNFPLVGCMDFASVGCIYSLQ